MGSEHERTLSRINFMKGLRFLNVIIGLGGSGLIGNGLLASWGIIFKVVLGRSALIKVGLDVSPLMTEGLGVSDPRFG